MTKNIKSLSSNISQSVRPTKDTTSKTCYQIWQKKKNLTYIIHSGNVLSKQAFYLLPMECNPYGGKFGNI